MLEIIENAIYWISLFIIPLSILQWSKYKSSGLMLLVNVLLAILSAIRVSLDFTGTTVFMLVIWTLSTAVWLYVYDKEQEEN